MFYSFLNFQMFKLFSVFSPDFLSAFFVRMSRIHFICSFRIFLQKSNDIFAYFWANCKHSFLLIALMKCRLHVNRLYKFALLSLQYGQKYRNQCFLNFFNSILLVFKLLGLLSSFFINCLDIACFRPFFRFCH